MTLSSDNQIVAPEVRNTSDDSLTLFSAEFGECYHSVFGARTESEHIFITNGLNRAKPNSVVLVEQKTFDKIKVLEVGLGTGLNLALTALNAQNRMIEYHAVELYPIARETMDNYIAKSEPDLQPLLKRITEAEWNTKKALTQNVTFTKHLSDIATAELPCEIDIVYFDAFSPERQPEMWSEEIFGRIYNQLAASGQLITYCSKGIVKRALQNVGFNVRRLPGPPHKRHILLAQK